MSIYQRGKTWYYDFQSRGERYAGCIGQVSKTVAKEVLTRKKAEAAEGRYSAPAKKPSPLLKDFVEEYFEYYRANRRPRSVVRHETSWHAVQPMLGTKRLDEISPLDLERYRRLRKQADRSEITINRELAFLRNLYNVAITWGKATENPVRKVRFAREHNERPRFLSPEEEMRLLDHCDVQLKPIVVTALHTGFRKSELLSLTWEDVDFASRSITVQAAYAKNGESRSVPMNDVLTTTLEEVRITFMVTGSVFRNRNGTPYRSFRSAFERAMRKAALHDFTFHDLRHTFASRLVMAGVDLPTVKELMGHKNISITLRYTHLSRDHKQRAVRTLEQFGAKSHQFSQQGGQQQSGVFRKSLTNHVAPLAQLDRASDF
jgi:integrase